MSLIFNTAKNFFEEDHWSFYKVPEQTIFFVQYRGKNGEWRGLAQADDEHKQFVFYSICPLHSPKEKIHRVAEFLTRANFGMLIGNFEIDLADGQIRYKTSIDVEGSSLDTALIKRMVYTNVLTMDKYLPGIISVMSTETEPEECIAKIENGS